MLRRVPSRTKHLARDTVGEKNTKGKKHYTLHPRKVGDKLESATRVVQVAHKPPARHATLGAASKLLHGMENGGRGTSHSPLAVHFSKSGVKKETSTARKSVYLYLV